MAPTLEPWLGGVIQEELQLGIHWLSRTLTEHRSGVKVEPDKLYEDDGDNLRITMTRALGQKSLVQVIKPTPTSQLTLSDGASSLPARLSRLCRQEFQEQYGGKEIVNGCFISILECTIIATPYGSSSQQIQLIIESLDWNGAGSGQIMGDPAPLRSRNQPTCLLAQLKALRAEPDESDNDEVVQSVEPDVTTDLAIDSQAPLATQAPHFMSQVWESHTSYGRNGRNPLEPTRTMSAQTEDFSKPRSKSPPIKLGKISDPFKVLDLLNPRNGQYSPRLPHYLKPVPHKEAPSTKLRQSPPSATRTTTLTAELAAVVFTKTGQSHLEATDHSAITSLNVSKSPGARGDAAKLAKGPPQSQPEPEMTPKSMTEVDYYSPGCDWMKGLCLTRAALTVPGEQRILLNNDESWLPSLPGKQFPGANIPIKLLAKLNELAERKSIVSIEVPEENLVADMADAKSEASTDASSLPVAHEDANSGAPGDTEPGALDDGEEVAPSSAVSWSSSPPPSSPRGNVATEHGLPPDSSLPEPAEKPAISAQSQKSDLSQTRHSPNLHDIHRNLTGRLPIELRKGSGPPNILESARTASRSPKQSSASEDTYPHPRMVTSHAETERRVPLSIQESDASLPFQRDDNHSTCYVQEDDRATEPPEQMDMDESEDDLEFSVPHGLGQDYQPAPAKGTFAHLSVDSKPFSSSVSHAEATVLVKETPYVKGNDSHAVIRQPCPPTQKNDSSNKVKAMASTYVVHSTYDDPTPAVRLVNNDVRESTHGQRQMTHPLPNQAHEQVQSTTQARSQSPHSLSCSEKAHNSTMSPKTGTSTSSPRVAQQNMTDNNRRPMKESLLSLRGQTLHGTVGHDSPKSAQVGQTFSGDRRGPEPFKHSQRLVPYEKPRSKEPLPKRKLSASPENEQGRSTKKRELKTVDLGFSQESELSQDPSVAAREHKQQWLEFYKGVHSGANSQGTVVGYGTPDRRSGLRVKRDGRNPSTNNIGTQSETPNKGSLLRVTTPSSSKNQAQGNFDREVIDLTGPIPSRRAPQTIFSRFKEAYPNYTGNAKDFAEICRQMLKLEMDDRMVPKWQWDDYIVRSNIDFEQYLSECAERGTSPSPYHRFYKDHIVGVNYDKGVVASIVTLSQAIEGAQSGFRPRSLYQAPARQSRWDR
ncbi:hypothetical protein GQ43DRAFT_195998 [Delitschia confertaspora ATCC 74209]|uniref:Telomere replication protein EST3 n=1 Tax=Delitschia confertaspora ATCC 74209 TaxID=1513339 RepID=A0A9P4JGP2_9PLEO|nr:hypothetical protein GQ43DRAFT_195998 [Delitschia confertaspora ATCC 74209]